MTMVSVAVLLLLAMTAAVDEMTAHRRQILHILGLVADFERDCKAAMVERKSVQALRWARGME